MRSTIFGHDGSRKVCCYNGRSTLGYSHGIALWYTLLSPGCMHAKIFSIFFSLLFNTGTMSDDEMRQLGVPALQDDGLIFLWVTGRAMELGRECLKLWGYEVN